ncbi:MAG: type II toxin-antitoxin system RatA family toxin [Vannielia sp.]|uniref:type II toxin-antitoxin system RatA family toxin n=1 Tax=Rhodobacterales TaxID=204455 RepID=UPI0020944DCA|nr:type II toxin-antitoxin system RatA family toxin [Oceanicola sp. 502str15]MCO6382153.1 type II toxin-antitoxin system RatA family toxin [Oceanicola sp. 502str15]
MTRHSETRQLPYSVQEIYDLVADVASYPKFLPWTAAARIRSQKPVAADELEHGQQRFGPCEIMEADLVISFKVFRETFLSRVWLFPEAKRIETRYIDGPFKHMRSVWQLKAVKGGCEVHFEVDFEFRNRILQGAAGMFFNEAMQRIVRAFEKRADELYGVKNGS